MAKRSHEMTSDLPQLRSWPHPALPLASRPVSPHAPSMGLLGNYNIGLNPRGTVLGPHGCHSDLRPGEVWCCHVCPVLNAGGMSSPQHLGHASNPHVTEVKTIDPMLRAWATLVMTSTIPSIEADGGAGQHHPSTLLR